MTSGVPIIRARGMTLCGFSISPARVDIDSHPEYIHIMIASPRFMAVRKLSPSGRMGLNPLPVPLVMPYTVKMSSGTMTRTWMIVSDQPVSSRPRMLMNVNTATMAMPIDGSFGGAEPPLVLHVVERQGHVDGGVDVEGERPPPAGLEAPVLAHAPADPAVEAAGLGDHGPELRGDERHRHAPDERQDEDHEERHPGAGRRDDVLHAERAGTGEREHEHDCGDQPHPYALQALVAKNLCHSDPPEYVCAGFRPVPRAQAATGRPLICHSQRSRWEYQGRRGRDVARPSRAAA